MKIFAQTALKQNVSNRYRRIDNDVLSMNICVSHYSYNDIDFSEIFLCNSQEEDGARHP